VGKGDPTGADRFRSRDRGKALAGKSTLNRLELTPPDATAASRYQKIVACPAAIEQLFVNLFLRAHRRPPAQIILDLDATDDPLHGHRRAASSTAIPRNSVTCPCTSSAASACSAPHGVYCYFTGRASENFQFPSRSSFRGR
jgi:hypothetical protein